MEETFIQLKAQAYLIIRDAKNASMIAYCDLLQPYCNKIASIVNVSSLVHIFLFVDMFFLSNISSISAKKRHK